MDESEAAGAAKKQEVPAYKRIVQEMIHSIDVAADFEEKHASASGVRGTWIAVKLVSGFRVLRVLHHTHVSADGYASQCSVLNQPLETPRRYPADCSISGSFSWRTPSDRSRRP